MKLFQGFTKKIIIILVIFSLYLLVFSTGILDLATGYSLKSYCQSTSKGDIYTQGTISGTTKHGAAFEKTDYCSLDNTNELKKYHCNLLTPNNWDSELIVCENGCKDGVCIK